MKELRVTRWLISDHIKQTENIEGFCWICRDTLELEPKGNKKILMLPDGLAICDVCAENIYGCFHVFRVVGYDDLFETSLSFDFYES
ncbi:MAG: hypothetical protein ACOC56_00105 [Atribacterota bacterium]